MPGIKMQQADALSRWLDHCPRDNHDNEQITLLSDDLFVNLLDMELQERILKATDLDFDITNALKGLLQGKLLTLTKDLDNWNVEELDRGRAIFYKGKNYVPRDEELRRDIMRMFHDHKMAGHPRKLETYNSVKEHYWWPGLRTFVKGYVKGCAICQQFKIDCHPSHLAFIPTEGSHLTKPFAYCSMDMIMDLPIVDRQDSFLVVVYQGLTKGVILLPCTKTITAEQVVTLLLDNLYKQFGLPDKIISNQGPQFTSQSFKELLKLLGIKSALSTAYHPQTNGTTEQVNQEIEAYLSIYCASHPEEWLHAILILKFTHNNQWHADQLWTPFELLYWESPVAIPTTFKHTKYPSIEEQINGMIKDREEALAARELAQRRIVERRKNTFTLFVKGQKVWLDTQNLKTSYHKKMTPKQEGPFEIKKSWDQ